MCLSNDQISQLVVMAIHQTNRTRDADERLNESAEASIFGNGSPLDSVGLVGFLADVEDLLAERGIQISLSDERAMSRSRSPYRDVPTLVVFIGELLHDDN